MIKKVREVTAAWCPKADEPIGIVISSGDRAEVRSLFSAYIWGPAPEPEAKPAAKVA